MASPVAESPIRVMAQANRAQRGTWAAILVALACVAAAVGIVGWQSSKPDPLTASSAGVVNAIADLQCASNGTDCDVHAAVAQAEPLWLYVGLGAAGVLLLVAFFLFVLRPAVPRVAATPAVVGPRPMDDDWA